MAENLTPQNQPDDELSVEELEEVAGGTNTNTGCPNTNCPCTGDTLKPSGDAPR